MRCLLTLLLIGLWIGLDAQTTTYPYNPDANGDSAIGAVDLLELLPIFGSYFSPNEIEVNNVSLSDYLNFLEAQIDSIASNENTSSSGIDSIFVENDELVVIMSGGESQHFPLPTPNQNITYTTNNYSATTTPNWLLKAEPIPIIGYPGPINLGLIIEQAAGSGLIASETDLGNFISLNPDVLFDPDWNWGLELVFDDQGEFGSDWSEPVSFRVETALSFIPNETTEDYVYWPENNYYLRLGYGHPNQTFNGFLPDAYVNQVSLNCHENQEWLDFNFSHFHPFFRNENGRETQLLNCNLNNTTWQMPHGYNGDLPVQLENCDLSNSIFLFPPPVYDIPTSPELHNCNLSNTKWRALGETSSHLIQAFSCDFTDATLYGFDDFDEFDFTNNGNTWTNTTFLPVSQNSLSSFPSDWISIPLFDSAGSTGMYKVIGN